MKDARGTVHLRGQGAEPAEPGAELLAEGVSRRAPSDPVGHRSGRRRRVHDHRLDLGGPPPRGQPDQAVPAGVQHPAQGRQELPVHQDHARRRLPPDRADAQAAPGRKPLLRPVRLGLQRRRGDEPRSPALPVPDVHDRHPGRRAGSRSAVPPVSHQALPGPLHRGHLEGRLSGRHRSGRALPRGPPGASRARAAQGDGGGERAPGVRAGGGHPRQGPGDRADDGEPEDGGVRPDRPRSARPGPTGQPGRRAAVHDPEREGDRPGRVPARGAARDDGRGDRLGLREPVLRPGDEHPEGGRDPDRAPGCSRPGGLPHRAPGGTGRDGRESGSAVSPSDIDLWVRTVDTAQARRRGPLGDVRLAVPRRGERRKLVDLATRNADEAIAREQARWLADEGKTLAALDQLASALDLPAAPLRIECYDISNVQGSDSVGSMVVFEDGRPRPGEYRRFKIRTVVGPERLRLAPGGAAAALPTGQGGRRGRRGGAPLGDAGPRDHRRRQGPGLARRRRSSTSSGCTTCRWPGSPRSGRSCSCRATRCRSSCRPRPRRSTSSSGSATRPIASRSRTTATSARSARRIRRSTTCRASARSGAARCSASSGRRSGSATRRSSRSRPCRGSGRRWRRGSRRPSRAERRTALV